LPQPPVSPVTKDFARKTLARRHRVVVRALGEAFFSPDGEVTEIGLDELVFEVDRFISPASKTLRFGLVLMLDIIRWAPMLMGHFKTFEELGVDDRVHVLERLEGSRVVQVPLLVAGYKTIMTMLFFETPRELMGLGYTEERTRYKLLPVTNAGPAAEPQHEEAAR
jgi:hypothetical protein